ncbi:MAG: DUF4176 domain-containing protein [Clostridium sp.]|nr:DUF4176 domain-containing protein [Clostridium sp.]
MENRLLPIGTVVQLKESTARVMVAGYLALGPSRPGYVWDYSGFKYPLGYVKDDEVYCFDQDQIETVLALGYQDMEQFEFIARLESAAEKVKSEAALENEEE